MGLLRLIKKVTLINCDAEEEQCAGSSIILQQQNKKANWQQKLTLKQHKHTTDLQKLLKTNRASCSVQHNF